jgi:NAD-dependent deacetylase
MSLNCTSIVVLTGAGISAESGIPTFRASDGLWHNHRVADVATPEAFRREPALVHNFYNMRRQQLLSAEIQHNAAHSALARLEQNFTGDFLLVTQNIDDLHERAGSEKLIHMHGELLKKRCMYCKTISEVRTDLSIGQVCDDCQQIGSLRPHIVWFGEMPFEMDRIFEQLSGCDLFISIGTSGNVYPAAGFVEVANQAGAVTVELNLEPTMQRSAFQERRYAKATEAVPVFVDEILNQR